MKKLVFLLISIIFLNGCSKDDSSSLNINIEEQTIEGKVILPEGSTLDLTNLSVQSYNGNSTINSDSYSINVTKGNHNFLFVSDTNDKVILMGYNHPSQTNFNINAESTIIALAMSMPINSLLTDSAKIDFLNKLKQNSNFSTVVAKMETLIRNGISPLDTNQNVFLSEFLSLFENTITNKTSNTKGDYNEDPVNIFKAGNKITFQNGGKFYETSVGIYKDDKRIEYIELDRIQLFATSASEAFSTANNLATKNFAGIDTVEKTYEFKEDGEYEIKIKTGAGSGMSNERREALFDNVSKWSMDFFLGLVPLKGNKECVQHVLNEVRSYTTLFMEGKKINTLADALSFSYDISKNVIQNLGQGIECLSKNPDYLKFSKVAKELFKWDSWVAKIGTAGNISFGIGQWLYDNDSMELCYQLNGNNLCPCDIGEDFVVLPVNINNGPKFSLVNENNLNFGQMKVGETYVLEAEIKNNSLCGINYSYGWSGGQSPFSPMTYSGSGVLESQESIIAQVAFQPKSKGSFNCSFLIFYDNQRKKEFVFSVESI